MAESGSKTPEPAAGARLPGIDVLRGLVMVLMVLDHARDFVGNVANNPTALATTTPALFFTRWITHLCAPVFVFLAGTAAWLYGERRERRTVALFLLTRGLWLVVLEFTLVHFAWAQSLTSSVWFVQVIAAIGVAMIALSALVFLPLPGLVAIGFVLVAGHNLLDPVRPQDFERSAAANAWTLLHEGGLLPFGEGRLLMVVYPLLPWIGVMALGYGFGAWLRRPGSRRGRTAGLGAALCLLFLVLRFFDLYGEPSAWAAQETALWSVMSFLNCTKYPPSLLYLAMTLGPALLWLAWVDREPGPVAERLRVFGRVPLFFYVAHLLVLSSGARLYHSWVGGADFRVFEEGLVLLFSGRSLPAWYGAPLPIVYLAWIAVVLLLYPACRAYGHLKRRGRSRLWSYL